jgi:Bacterial PH domain
MIYRSKIDTWLLAVSIAAISICLFLIFFALTAAAVEQRWLILVSAIVGMTIQLWFLLSTTYTLEPGRLIIRSGPFKWTHNPADIKQIVPTRNPLSSPALSLDRLRIEFNDNRSVMISPADKEGFLRELESLKQLASER